MRASILVLCALAFLVVATPALAVDVDSDFSDPTLEADVLLEETPDLDDAEDNNTDSDEEDSDEEEDVEEDEEPTKIDVHLYLPVPAGATVDKKTPFPQWPDIDGKLKPKSAKNGKKAAAGNGAKAAAKGDFLSNNIGLFQNKVAAIARRLKKEKAALDKKDKAMDAHLAAIKAKIEKAKRTIEEIKKEDASEQAAALRAAREKALRDKMNSHPVLSKLYAARKFVVELKRMVRALSTLNPASVQYANQMKQIQTKMAEAREAGSGLADVDDMVAVGASISDIEIDKVRDDEVAGLNGVLCAMMKHIQGQINEWEAKLRADHDAELNASAGKRDARLSAAQKALAEAEAALANYKAKMQREHIEIKAKLRQINAELAQLDAIDGHVTNYRRTAVSSAAAGKPSF